MMKENRVRLFDQLSPYLPAHLAQKLTPDIDPVEIQMITQRIRSVRNTLSTYLPRYLVEEIQSDPTPGKVSGGFREGAALFADVSGFTAMSRKLSAFGREGAEEITGIVNNYFTAMLDISENFGGDLLKFGGDALLIFFDGESGPIRSLAAGHAMMSAIKRFSSLKTSQGEFPLQMKIGIASGSIFMANLGTPVDMDYAILGRTLTEMAHAETLAEPGQIVVSDRVRQATIPFTEYTPAQDGFWALKSLNLPTEAIKALSTRGPSKHLEQDNETPIQIDKCIQEVKIIAGLSPYVPEELLSRIITDPKRLGLYSSHRPVTVMFVNFYGIEALFEGVGEAYPDTITQILNTHYVTMSEVNSQYGGTINRLDTYTKGNRFLMVFGALKAHEDDPQRAVRTAIEMNRKIGDVNRKIEGFLAEVPALQESVGSMVLKQRIGVNSGFVFAGNTGSGGRREYTVMGDEVNLTARLMSIAQDGEVLIGQSTARQLSPAFDLAEKERVLVKGIQEPIRNYLVKGIRELSRRKSIQGTGMIAGREDELQLGRTIVDETLQGNGKVLIIKGVSGIGKTRFAEEIVFYGQKLGMDLLIGTCLSYGNTMTYHPWAELLRAYFGIEGTDLSKDTATRMITIQRGMDAINEGLWTPVIGTVMGLEIPDNDITRDMDPQLRRQRVLDLTLKLLLERARRQPLVVMIEDMHWADPASMDLIGYIGRNLGDHPLTLILPHRPDEGLPDWSAHPHVSSLELGDLPLDASMDIITDLLGEADLPEPVYDLILDKGGGNPFYIAEVVRALIDSGAFQQDTSDVWQVSRDLSTLDLPDTIHGVILSRIDRLIATHRQILRVSSVIGRIFDRPTLDGVYPYDDVGQDMRDHLSSLSQLGLTELQAIEREIYRFIHLTTREVVYGSLSYEHRRSLHRDIGGFIELASHGSLSEQTDLLAYHFYEGQAWAKAMDYNLASAHNAQREFANETAILSGQRALESATRAIRPGFRTPQPGAKDSRIITGYVRQVAPAGRSQPEGGDSLRETQRV
jgi:class 3 adenylate cyclase